jgi:hypothetical protein
MVESVDLNGGIADYYCKVFAGVYDFPLNHTTTLFKNSMNRTFAHIQHVLQETSYFVNLRWPKKTPLKLIKNEPPNSAAITAHRYTLSPMTKSSSIAFTAHFSTEPRVPNFPARIHSKNSRAWEKYWKEGGFVDLTESSNPNATELQRRIITSQYHVRVNSAANEQTPQESGLMNNGWYGALLRINSLR